MRRQENVKMLVYSLHYAKLAFFTAVTFFVNSRYTNYNQSTKKHVYYIKTIVNFQKGLYVYIPFYREPN